MMRYLLLLMLLTSCSAQLNCLFHGQMCRGEPGKQGRSGPAGPAGEAGPAGLDGRDGRDGRDGADGADGESCQVTPVIGGTVITCSLTSLVVLNGADGADGADGIDGEDAISDFTPAEIVDPCGTTPGIVNEVFFKLNNGMLVASYSENPNGLNTRLAIVPPGTYQTTDTTIVGKRCQFSVANDYSLYDEFLY